MNRSRLVLVALWALAAPLTLSGQTPPAASAAPSAVADNLPTPPADFTYSPAGRRDPFSTLTRGTTATVATTSTVRPRGAAGLLTDEISVRGIVLSNGTYVAMVAGPAAGQTFSVRAGSQLFDGRVQTVTAREVVIVQQVSDPLSLQKQREVRKLLRAQEEGK